MVVRLKNELIFLVYFKFRNSWFRITTKKHFYQYSVSKIYGLFLKLWIKIRIQKIMKHYCIFKWITNWELGFPYKNYLFDTIPVSLFNYFRNIRYGNNLLFFSRCEECEYFLSFNYFCNLYQNEAPCTLTAEIWNICISKYIILLRVIVVIFICKCFVLICNINLYYNSQVFFIFINRHIKNIYYSVLTI